MERQDAQRKVLRIDDQTDETSGGAPQRPSTRSAIAGQRSGGPVPPEQKFAASYQRMKELNDKTRQDLESQVAAPVVASAPTESPAIEVPQPQVHSQQVQRLQTDLSLLVTAGRIEEDIIVGGFKFRLSSLTSGEQDDVVSAVSLASGDDLVKLGQLRLQILAHAIRLVNGVPLENLYQGPDKHSEGFSIKVAEKRLAVLKSWQLAFTMKLFDEYSKILERSEKVFQSTAEDDELLKN